MVSFTVDHEIQHEMRNTAVVGPHVIALVCAALLSGARVADPTSHLQPRRYVTLPVRVDTLRDGARDDTLARPLLLTADDQRIYWFDYGDGRLSAMDTTGRLLWRAGRRGPGPGEFANPTSLLAVRGGGEYGHGAHLSPPRWCARAEFRCRRIGRSAPPATRATRRGQRSGGGGLSTWHQARHS